MLKNSLRTKHFRILAMIAAAVLFFGFETCDSGNDGDKLGTSANPCLISTENDLAALAFRVNSGTEPSGMHYKLADDIDLSAYSAGSGWTPIGNNSNPFKGNFDGNGKAVSNLYIDDDGLDFAGLFGSLSGGTVNNIVVENAIIAGSNHVGGVAGVVKNGGSISNCYVTGEISGNQGVGGVAGTVEKNGSSISNCSVTGNVSGYYFAGGVAGLIDDDGSVNNCYTTGNVSGYNGMGGIAGLLDGKGSVSNCYAAGEVSGNLNVGGIAGYVGDGFITDCAALNDHSGGSETTFGRVTDDFYGSMICNNVVLMTTTTASPFDDPNDIHGDGYNKATVTDQDIYDTSPLTWNFGGNDANPWKWVGGSYPLPLLY